jgi:hypothetical protein
MTGFSDIHRNTVSNIDDLFDIGGNFINELATKLDEVDSGQISESLTNRVFGSGAGTTTTTPSKRNSKEISLSSGLISTTGAKAERVGEVTPIASVDPRLIEAAWFDRLAKIRKTTSSKIKT